MFAFLMILMMVIIGILSAIGAIHGHTLAALGLVVLLLLGRLSGRKTRPLKERKLLKTEEQPENEQSR